MAAAIVRFYGAKRDTDDYRDLKKKYWQHEIPGYSQRSHDLSCYVQHVYDQKNLDSCTANALCAAYGLDLFKQSLTTGGGYFDPSRLFLYYNTRECKNPRYVYSDTGASIRDTIKAMNRKGVCKESEWPYDVKKFNKKPPQRCYDTAVGNNLCKYERLDRDINQFRACLKKNCPFVFGFNVYKSFESIADFSNGDMPMPTVREQRSQPIGQHAVVAVGYDDSRRRIKVLNSWGSSWGDNGYFYMPYDFIKDPHFCFDFWKITFACERGKPRPQDMVGSRSDFGLLGPSTLGANDWARDLSGGACGFGSSSNVYGSYEADSDSMPFRRSHYYDVCRACRLRGNHREGGAVRTLRDSHDDNDNCGSTFRVRANRSERRCRYCQDSLSYEF